MQSYAFLSLYAFRNLWVVIQNALGLCWSLTIFRRHLGNEETKQDPNHGSHLGIPSKYQSAPYIMTRYDALWHQHVFSDHDCKCMQMYTAFDAKEPLPISMSLWNVSQNCWQLETVKVQKAKTGDEAWLHGLVPRAIRLHSERLTLGCDKDSYALLFLSSLRWPTQLFTKGQWWSYRSTLDILWMKFLVKSTCDQCHYVILYHILTNISQMNGTSVRFAIEVPDCVLQIWNWELGETGSCPHIPSAESPFATRK